MTTTRKTRGERADVTIGTLWQRFWSCVFALLAAVLLLVNVLHPDFSVQTGWPIFIFVAALLWLARVLWRVRQPLTDLVD